VAIDEGRKARQGDGAVKRLYFLVAIATVQIILGSLTMLQAAQPLRMYEDVLVPSGSYYRFEFGVIGTGQLVGNLSELRGRAFHLAVFDERGYISFRDGANAVPPLFEHDGTSTAVNLTLPGSGAYYLVAVDLPARQELQVHLDLIVVGLKPIETIVALIVLVGGLALVGASLMLSVWSWRQGPPAPTSSPDPLPDSFPDSSSSAVDPVDPAQDPRDDKTRIY
jgi:hypothetical protein